MSNASWDFPFVGLITWVNALSFNKVGHNARMWPLTVLSVLDGQRSPHWLSVDLWFNYACKSHTLIFSINVLILSLWEHLRAPGTVNLHYFCGFFYAPYDTLSFLPWVLHQPRFLFQCRHCPLPAVGCQSCRWSRGVKSDWWSWCSTLRTTFSRSGLNPGSSSAGSATTCELCVFWLWGGCGVWMGE